MCRSCIGPASQPQVGALPAHKSAFLLAAGQSTWTLAFRGRRLITSGFATIGILMTLHPKRTIDSARGSLPGRKLPTAERWCWDRPAGPIGIYLLSSIFYRLTAAIPSESLCLLRRHPPFTKGGLTISLRRFHQFPLANLRLLRSHLLPEEGGRQIAAPPQLGT